MYTFEALPWFLIKQAGWGFRLVQDILHRNNLSLCGREAIISCKKFASRAPKAVGFYHSPPLQEQQRAFQRENSCIEACQISLPYTGRTPAQSHCSQEIESSQSCQCSCPRDGFSAVVLGPSDEPALTLHTRPRVRCCQGAERLWNSPERPQLLSGLGVGCTGCLGLGSRGVGIKTTFPKKKKITVPAITAWLFKRRKGKWQSY